MIEVKPRDNSDEAFEDAMRAFKKAVNNEGNVQILKEKRFYKKPSEIRNEKKRKRLALLNKTKGRRK